MGKSITGLRFERVIIDGGSHALQVQSPGGASFSAVVANGLESGGTLQCDSGFVIEDEGGNAGWRQPLSPARIAHGPAGCR
jgi:hypothetical protein